MKEKLPLIVAIVFGIIAFVGINSYLKKQDQPTQVATVLVVNKALAKGDRLAMDDVGRLQVPRDMVRNLSGYFIPGNESLLVGMVLAKDMKPNEPIFEGNFILPEDAPRVRRFSEKLRVGERAISLPVDSPGSVSNFIRVDDRVDILANIAVPEQVVRTFTVPNEGVQEVTDTEYRATTLFMFENVKVLAVGDMFEELEDDRLGGGGGGNVTIAVTPREAQILAWAMRNGTGEFGGSQVTFTLLLRSQQDKGYVYPRELVTYKDLLDLTRMQELQELRLEQEGLPGAEVYQGGIPQNQPM